MRRSAVFEPYDGVTCTRCRLEVQVFELPAHWGSVACDRAIQVQAIAAHGFAALSPMPDIVEREVCLFLGDLSPGASRTPVRAFQPSGVPSPELADARTLALRGPTPSIQSVLDVLWVREGLDALIHLATHAATGYDPHGAGVLPPPEEVPGAVARVLRELRPYLRVPAVRARAITLARLHTGGALEYLRALVAAHSYSRVKLFRRVEAVDPESRYRPGGTWTARSRP